MPGVRPLRPEEWPALRELRLRALKSDPTSFVTTYEEALAWDDARWQERATGSEDFRTFVADDEGTLVAMAAGFRDDDDADTVHVISVWTAPEARGRGVARELIATVLDWARGRGMNRARLWVAAHNARAASVYAGLGFLPSGERAPHPKDPSIVEIEMLRDL